ncbi:MAG: hypothetical protein IT287_08725 [Bdellovibrionaceae bacterium]|nr:hypothetical protein [Pseudobdellovibrionaceae bacterium]
MNNKNLFLSYLSLFTSFGTLLCCALPSLLVVLGMGATVAGLVGAFPQIVILSEYKKLVFGVSGFLIATSLVWLYSQRNAPCPIDPHQARSCAVARKWSLGITIFSAVFWSIGFAAAFILPMFY